ncbi:hypothetical protein L3Q82_011428, partial [Scortum barcoo]
RDASDCSPVLLTSRVGRLYGAACGAANDQSWFVSSLIGQLKRPECGLLVR